MTCRSCGSENQTKFSAEINIHFLGLKNMDKSAVLVFPEASGLLRLRLHGIHHGRNRVASTRGRCCGVVFRAGLVARSLGTNG